jgi:hypothetical protein
MGRVQSIEREQLTVARHKMKTTLAGAYSARVITEGSPRPNETTADDDEVEGLN